MAAIAARARSVIDAGRRRLFRARRMLVALAVIVACVVLALGGLWLGLRLNTPATYSSALGTASFQVQASSHGSVEVFIPLTDWGLRAHAFKAPVKLHVEPRVLNRQALLAAANGDEQLLKRTATDLSRDGQRAIQRAIRFLVLGTLIAAALGWGVLRIYRCRNRRLLIAVPAGTVLVALLIGGGALWRLHSTWRSEALSHPTYYARGAELIQLLNAAQHASRIENSYASKLEGALSGFASLLANPNQGAVDAGRRALLVSDLHNNTLALGSLDFYAQGQPVFFVGDFGNTGNAAETKALAGPLSALGSRVIAVSGNHDSQAMMLALARRGVTVLTSQGQLLADGTYGPQTVLVDGLRVAGFDDPMEYRGSSPDDPKRIFSFGELPDATQALDSARAHLLAWFRGLPQRPDVVLIHENGLAQYLAQALATARYSHPLTILTGHDHLQHVNHTGPIDLVDAGTVGAGGIYGIGSDDVGLGELHWAANVAVLEAADLIRIEPVSGGAQAQRVVLSVECAVTHTNCTTAVDYTDPKQGSSTGTVSTGTSTAASSTAPTTAP